ncbi:PspC domain-containing protein [Abyssibacter sp.]|uniref:PspC domain-containing protein n=1 Tax=Abyssibacter sp. TaxID=2320200 RepID=UPI000C3D45FB|nr:PspC domain-containing protein [Abyssibacter sp.]MBB86403.1 envelope stress response membrane protein PspC [Xanthomonadales bacterium]MCK5858683.1 PspC domain-containing protein [Abyssibacter sp.]
MKRSRSLNLHRDPDNGWIAGVCAGLATYFDVDRKVVRIIMVLGLIFFAWPTLIAYVVAACLLPKKSRAAEATTATADFEADDTDPDNMAYTPNLHEVEDDFDHLERKLRGLEAYLSSKDLELNRAFRNLERGENRASG